MGTGKACGQGPPPPPGHPLDGADGVLIVIAAQPVGGVVFLGEILEDLHEGPWEDARGSPDSALRRKYQGRLVCVKEGSRPRLGAPRSFIMTREGRRSLGSLMQREEK